MVMFLVKTLIKNSIFTAIILIFVGLRRLIFNIFIGRNFGAAELGVVNIALATVFLLGPFVSFFKGATTKYMSEYLGKGDANSANAMFRIGFFFTLILSIVSIMIMFIFYDWFIYKTNVGANNFLYVVVLIPLSAFYLHYQLIYYGINKVKHYFIMEFLANIVFFIFLGISVYYYKSAFLLPFILTYLLFFMISTYFFKSYFKPIPADNKIITLKATKFSSYLLIGNLVGVVGREFSVLITSSYVSTLWLGYYVAAFTLLKPLNLIPSVLRPVIYPSQSYQFGKGRFDLISKTLNESTRWLAVLTSFMCGIYILLSDFILEVMFSSSFTMASLTMQILAIGMFCAIITVPSNNTLTGTKYVRTQTIISIIYLIAMVIPWIFLIPVYGIIGTAIGIGLSELIFMILCMYYGWKLFDLDIKTIIKIIFSFSTILIISFIIKQHFPLYPIIMSISVFSIFFVLLNKQDFQGIFNEILLIIKKKVFV